MKRRLASTYEPMRLGKECTFYEEQTLWDPANRSYQNRDCCFCHLLLHKTKVGDKSGLCKQTNWSVFFSLANKTLSVFAFSVSGIN